MTDRELLTRIADIIDDPGVTDAAARVVIQAELNHQGIAPSSGPFHHPSATVGTDGRVVDAATPTDHTTSGH
jgi:hypothetical protein